MASARRTYDTDSITLRTVFAKNPDNTNVPALRTLTADGAGGSYWAIPSTLGVIPAFNQINTDAGTYTADLSYNIFRLTSGEGIGMVNGPAGSNQTILFAKAFNQFDVSGNNSLKAFTTTLNATVNFAGQGGIQIIADPATNTMIFNGACTPTCVSTGIYGFNQIKVTPVTSTITSSITQFGGEYITANSPSTLLRFAGVNDIQLSTNVTTNSVFFTISTFTSQGYLDISANAYGAYPSTLSTVSSLYVQLPVYTSTIQSFSTNTGLQFSSVLSSINALAMSTGDQFYILTGLINARATIIQLNSEIADVNSNIQSTSVGLGTLGYVSSPKYNFISSLEVPYTYGPNEANVSFTGFGAMTYSTFTFNLSSFSSYINADTKVLLDVRPMVVFSGISTTTSNYGTQWLGQISQIGLQEDALTSFTESQTSNMIGYSPNEAQSNLFTTPLLMPLAASNVQTYIQSNFATYHYIPGGYFFDDGVNSNTLGFSQSTITLGSYANSLFLHIYNS